MAGTPRDTPGGVALGDGYQSLITFEDDSDVEFFEKEVTPPGIDGGDKVDTTTMHNVTYKTAEPQSLKEFSDASCVCAYDPTVLSSIIALVNVKQIITITFPNGDYWEFWGHLKSFTPQNMTNGEQPEAQVEIACDLTNDSGSETAPAWTNNGS